MSIINKMLVNGVQYDIEDSSSRSSIESLSERVATLETALANRLDYEHPIGSLYFSKTATDPHDLFGGSWTPIKDVFILAAGDSFGIDTTGGSATVALDVESLPLHTHTMNGAGGHAHVYSFANREPFTEDGSATQHSSHIGWSDAWTSAVGDHTHEINAIGGGEPHNNMPPYRTYYVWQRTA